MTINLLVVKVPPNFFSLMQLQASMVTTLEYLTWSFLCSSLGEMERSKIGSNAFKSFHLNLFAFGYILGICDPEVLLGSVICLMVFVLIYVLPVVQIAFG